MIILTSIFKRPSVDVSFFPQTDYWQTTWKAKIDEAISQGHLTRPDNFRVESEDQLTLTMITHWRSAVDNSNFLCDPVVTELNEIRDAHFAENSISGEFNRHVVIDEHDQE